MECDVVFEGGGAKGIALVGAWEEFLAQGYSAGRILGTSAGAIMAALVAAGYTVGEMTAALTETENGKHVFAGFLGTPPAATAAEIEASAIADFLHDLDLPVVGGVFEANLDRQLLRAFARHPTFPHLYSFVERGGWYTADRFLSWLQAKLDAPHPDGRPRGYSGMTLAEFFAATQVELSLIASDVSASRMLVLNHNTAPGCPLVWAVRMSMSIPLLWQEVIWEAAWGDYRGRPMTGHAVVDGGLLSNFPIELFISDLPHVVAAVGPQTGAPVVGLLIDEALPLPSRPDAFLPGVAVGELRTVQRLQRLVDTATTAHDKMVIEAFEDWVVRLPAHGYGTTEFDMSEARRNALLEAARAATRRQLTAHPPRHRAAGLVNPTAQASANRVAQAILNR
ncbi:MAG TPA: patatin-like phospholipase family protein [Caldilineaceae bacterium]|nr:patatin-like phospholipase family protein [Caldilineaceae bacterium]